MQAQAIEVWEVIATYKGVDEDFNRLQKAYYWLIGQQLRSAIGYYKTYPEEIVLLIKQNEGLTEEHIHNSHTLPGDNFSLIARAIMKYDSKHSHDVKSYGIDFLKS